MDTRREQIIDIVTREFIGPDPINKPGMIQENGEEILSSDPPRIRYAAGILFPQKVSIDSNTADENSEVVENDTPDMSAGDEPERHGGTKEYLADAEEMINLSNAYQQSAISMTAAVLDSDTLIVNVSAGMYSSIKVADPETGIEHVKYPRIPLNWNNNGMPIDLPDETTGIKKYRVMHGEQETRLVFAITYRYKYDGYSLYTFTLQNDLICETSIRDEDCYFQVQFDLISEQGFSPMPETEKLTSDNDYLSNQMLYRNIKTYAIGHGCAAKWDENEFPVKKLSTSIFPMHEIKPIVPSKIDGVSLEMYKMSDYGNKEETISELTAMCEKYAIWINGLSEKVSTINDRGTAIRHIENCRRCLKRMKEGVELLKNDADVLFAFQLMNRAMLLQQLHYNLPLQKWVCEDGNTIHLKNPVEVLPDVSNQETWYGDKSRYGKWRPFQLAFVLMNLKSMAKRNCNERSIVDLIWFPTGGGKTEAYLGLSAYTIFIRRIKNKNNAGTAILMRYTLRLLTSQQYERAAAMICACDVIRKEFEDKLGKNRISIGLWVGDATTPNTMKKAVDAYKKIYRDGSVSENSPIVILKCPWCGAQMGVVPTGKTYKIPGYKKVPDGRKEKLILQCENKEHGCEFSKIGFELPLQIVDDDIYANPPTLLLGTVDKFAMLPYRPEAQTLFGIKNGNRVTAPDLIIQDELHLISGPLGSMVGHYETMINELCAYEKDGVRIQPKIIASTATISRASEQCKALYGCPTENVMQFPPPGLEAGNSFFAEEDREAIGRMYVGVFAAGSSSIATTTIRLYATLLYAAKAISVKNESDRDGYWTNVGYFNSIRELGQTETWIKADIDEYLHVIYKRRYEDKEEGYKENRRYIYKDEELTSRVSSDKIPFSLQNLSYEYPMSAEDKRPVDICLATNMISVGVDVPRLGLMTVSGQPKTTSEYIQATSRVGRNKKAPGLVFTIYNPGKPRDRSHYEHFETYHSRVYCNVEPTSVTPFSAQLRERALHAIVFGLLRLRGDNNLNADPPKFPSLEKIQEIKDIIAERIEAVDVDELEKTLEHIDSIVEKWKREEPGKYQDFGTGEVLPLMFRAGAMRNATWGKRGFPTPTSMRNVDASCEAMVLENGYFEEDE
ncbi:MAG: helicase [Clostridia bacterium]|nr:helicase [Clostridia bacterium]